MADRFKEANNVKALFVCQWLEHSYGVGPRLGGVVFLFLRRNLARSAWVFYAEFGWASIWRGLPLCIFPSSFSRSPLRWAQNNGSSVWWMGWHL